MLKYLTARAIFKCSCNPAITFRCSDSGQTKVSYKGQHVLNNKASLSLMTSPPPQCPILTFQAQGTPIFCQNKLGPWLPNDLASLVIAGSPLLTDGASRPCILCPGQQVSLLEDPVNLAGLLHKGQAHKLAAPQALSFLEAAEVPAIEEWKPFNGASSAAKGGEDGRQSAVAAQDGEAISASSAQTPSEDAQEEKEEEDGLEYRCSICAKPCQLQEKYMGKRPPWDEAPLDLGSDSIALRRNYHLYLGCKSCSQQCGQSKGKTDQAQTQELGGRRKADGQYCDAWKKGIYRFQAHHVISGRQVFQPLEKGKTSPCKNENILRMAHVCDYDVNRAENCIMLVSNSEDEAENEKLELKRPSGAADEKEVKAAEKFLNAYESMQGAKLQWHVGNHSYKFSPEALEQLKGRIKFYTKKDGEVVSYAELLARELEKINRLIEKEVMTDRKPICPRTFIRRMDKLSGKIRVKLEAFATGYHLSYPYYVSKEAYNFAFQLPQSFRLITVQRDGSDIKLKKFSISRKMDGTISAALYDPLMGGGAEGSFSKPQDRNALIRFCANLEYFIFFGQTGADTMPFHIDRRHYRKVSAGKEDAKAYVENNAYELIVWIRDNPVKYKGQYKRVNERLAEVNV